MNITKKKAFNIIWMGLCLYIIAELTLSFSASEKRDDPQKSPIPMPPLPPMPERKEQAPVLENQFQPKPDEWVIMTAGPDIREPEIDPFIPCATNIYRLRGVVWASTNLNVLTNKKVL